jgi:hypothetical protein
MKVERSSFLTINFYCLPHPTKEKEKKKFQKLYKQLHNQTVSTAMYFGKLGVYSEAYMLNLFHSDLMSYGLGTEVKVVIENVPLRAEYCRYDFLRSVMLVIKEVFPDTIKIVGEVHLEKKDEETYFIMEDH